jgi:hypothetical protein
VCRRPLPLGGAKELLVLVPPSLQPLLLPLKAGIELRLTRSGVDFLVPFFLVMTVHLLLSIEPRKVLKISTAKTRRRKIGRQYSSRRVTELH